MLQYFVVGTSHPLQERSPRFRQEVLERIVSTRNVVLIAEEIDANKPDEQQRSMGRDLANTTNPKIEWLSIDMTIHQERDARIFDDLEYERELRGKGINAFAVRAQDVRERHWLKCIKGKCDALQLTDGVVLITCGIFHLDTLPEKIKETGATEVEKEDFPPGRRDELGPLVRVRE